MDSDQQTAASRRAQSFYLDWLLGRIAFEHGSTASAFVEGIIDSLVVRNVLQRDKPLPLALLASALRKHADAVSAKKCCDLLASVFTLTEDDECANVFRDEWTGLTNGGASCADRPDNVRQGSASMEARPDKASIIPSLGEQQFQRELPKLLSTNLGEWVAYHGAVRIGFAPTKFAAYKMCFQKNLRESEFVVHCVEPQEVEIAMGLG